MNSFSFLTLLVFLLFRQEMRQKVENPSKSGIIGIDNRGVPWSSMNFVVKISLCSSYFLQSWLSHTSPKTCQADCSIARNNFSQKLCRSSVIGYTTPQSFARPAPHQPHNPYTTSYTYYTPTIHPLIHPLCTHYTIYPPPPASWQRRNEANHKVCNCERRNAKGPVWGPKVHVTCAARRKRRWMRCNGLYGSSPNPAEFAPSVPRNLKHFRKPHKQ